MITHSDLLHLPYTPDLTEAGIAYALRSLTYTYNRMGGSPYDRLRRIVAGVAVELAFRRYLSEQNIPFDIKGATPFTDPDHYDVALGKRRCDIKSFLITHRQQISAIRRHPQLLLKAPALVPSDQHAGSSHSPHDLYLFAFLPALIAASQSELQQAMKSGQPHYLVHMMPDTWNRPSQWSPLGRLALKSESEETHVIEIGGQDTGRASRSLVVELPPRRRVEIESGLFSVSHVHIQGCPTARIGIHSPARRETHVIGALEWSNIWVYGTDMVLAGYLTREEFSRRASFIQAGSRVFQYNTTNVKNLAVPVSDLKPFSELFERVRQWALAAA